MGDEPSRTLAGSVSDPKAARTVTCHLEHAEGIASAVHVSSRVRRVHGCTSCRERECHVSAIVRVVSHPSQVKKQ